jgi:hypothetical protein
MRGRYSQLAGSTRPHLLATMREVLLRLTSAPPSAADSGPSFRSHTCIFRLSSGKHSFRCYQFCLCRSRTPNPRWRLSSKHPHSCRWSRKHSPALQPPEASRREQRRYHLHTKLASKRHETNLSLEISRPFTTEHAALHHAERCKMIDH